MNNQMIAQSSAVEVEKPIVIKFDAKITSIEKLGATIDVASVKMFRNNMDDIFLQKCVCKYVYTGNSQKVCYRCAGRV